MQLMLPMKFFSSNAFKKWKNASFEGRFNRAIFDIMVYYFSIPEIRQIALTKRNELKDEFKRLSESNIEFLNSFEASTKSIHPTNVRFKTWGTAVSRICSIDIALPNIPNR